MFSSFSIPFSIPKFGFGTSGGINLPSVRIHDVETTSEKKARALKHLLKLNHVNHAVLHNDLRFHNHLPHLLCSAYLMGGKHDHLDRIYDVESRSLEPWKDSPGEISLYDWRDYLGKRDYQRAFLDFFEDQLVLHGYDWKKVVEEFLLSGKEPLVNCLVAGLGHPLIHLGYAYEMSSRELAMEALTLTATCYNGLHKYLESSEFSSKPTSYSSSSPLGIFTRIRADKQFDALFDQPGGNNLDILFRDHEEAVLDYWNTWRISDPGQQFRDSQMAATALLLATHKTGYDFFLVHLLTTSHAVRILIPFFPSKYHVLLVRQWWLITVAIYIAQLRPKIDLEDIYHFDLQGRDWEWADSKAVGGEWSTDAHYVKAIRAMKEAGQTWGDEDKFYLKAAVKFASEFSGWGGFSAEDAEHEELEGGH